MLDNIFDLLYGALLLFFLYFITKQLFNFLLRGFAPFISARPWVIKQLMEELELLKLKEKTKIYSFGSGHSGFLHGVEKKYPTAILIGVEFTWLAYFVSKMQVLLKMSKIKVIKSDLHRVNIQEADLIYCWLDFLMMRGLEKKFKFECRPGAVLISNGLVIPNFEPKKIITIDNRKGRLAFLSLERILWRSKIKKSKKENKVYFYEI